MAALLVKSFEIDNSATTDAQIAAGIAVTATGGNFSVGVVPISNTRSRVIVFSN